MNTSNIRTDADAEIRDLSSTIEKRKAEMAELRRKRAERKNTFEGVTSNVPGTDSAQVKDSATVNGGFFSASTLISQNGGHDPSNGAKLSVFQNSSKLIPPTAFLTQSSLPRATALASTMTSMSGNGSAVYPGSQIASNRGLVVDASTGSSARVDIKSNSSTNPTTTSPLRLTSRNSSSNGPINPFAASVTATVVSEPPIAHSAQSAPVPVISSLPHSQRNLGATLTSASAPLSLDQSFGETDFGAEGAEIIAQSAPDESVLYTYPGETAGPTTNALFSATSTMPVMNLETLKSRPNLIVPSFPAESLLSTPGNVSQHSTTFVNVATGMQPRGSQAFHYSDISDVSDPESGLYAHMHPTPGSVATFQLRDTLHSSHAHELETSNAMAVSQVHGIASASDFFVEGDKHAHSTGLRTETTAYPAVEDQRSMAQIGGPPKTSQPQSVALEGPMNYANNESNDAMQISSSSPGVGYGLFSNNASATQSTRPHVETGSGMELGSKKPVAAYASLHAHPVETSFGSPVLGSPTPPRLRPPHIAISAENTNNAYNSHPNPFASSEVAAGVVGAVQMASPLLPLVPGSPLARSPAPVRANSNIRHSPVALPAASLFGRGTDTQLQVNIADSIKVPTLQEPLHQQHISPEEVQRLLNAVESLQMQVQQEVILKDKYANESQKNSSERDAMEHSMLEITSKLEMSRQLARETYEKYEVERNGHAKCQAELQVLADRLVAAGEPLLRLEHMQGLMQSREQQVMALQNELKAVQKQQQHASMQWQERQKQFEAELVNMQQKVHTYKKDNAVLLQQLDRQKEEFEGNQAQFAFLQSQLTDKASLIASLNKQLSTTSHDQQNKQVEIEQLRVQIQNFESERKSSSEAMQALQDQVDTLQVSLDTQQMELQLLCEQQPQSQQLDAGENLLALQSLQQEHRTALDTLHQLQQSFNEQQMQYATLYYKYEEQQQLLTSRVVEAPVSDTELLKAELARIKHARVDEQAASEELQQQYDELSLRLQEQEQEQMEVEKKLKEVSDDWIERESWWRSKLAAAEDISQQQLIEMEALKAAVLQATNAGSDNPAESTVPQGKSERPLLPAVNLATVAKIVHSGSPGIANPVDSVVNVSTTIPVAAANSSTIGNSTPPVSARRGSGNGVSLSQSHTPLSSGALRATNAITGASSSTPIDPMDFDKEQAMEFMSEQEQQIQALQEALTAAQGTIQSMAQNQYINMQYEQQWQQMQAYANDLMLQLEQSTAEVQSLRFQLQEVVPSNSPPDRPFSHSQRLAQSANEDSNNADAGLDLPFSVNDTASVKSSAYGSSGQELSNKGSRTTISLLRPLRGSTEFVSSTVGSAADAISKLVHSRGGLISNSDSVLPTSMGAASGHTGLSPRPATELFPITGTTGSVSTTAATTGNKSMVYPMDEGFLTDGPNAISDKDEEIYLLRQRIRNLEVALDKALYQSRPLTADGSSPVQLNATDDNAMHTTQVDAVNRNAETLTPSESRGDVGYSIDSPGGVTAIRVRRQESVDIANLQASGVSPTQIISQLQAEIASLRLEVEQYQRKAGAEETGSADTFANFRIASDTSSSQNKATAPPIERFHMPFNALLSEEENWAAQTEALLVQPRALLFLAKHLLSGLPAYMSLLGKLSQCFAALVE